MRRSFQEDELTEVFVNGDKYPLFGRSPSQDFSIARVRTAVPGFGHIMSLSTQPFCQTMTRAPVNQELHSPTTPTASRESWVITACA